MKFIILISCLILTSNLWAQGHETGGGQFDPTAKKSNINFKKAEKSFKKNLKANWQRCGYGKETQPPHNFVTFYQKFKDEKLSINLSDMVDPAKGLCADCFQQQLAAKDGGNFLCLIYDEKFQEVLYALSRHSTQAREYMQDDIEVSFDKSLSASRIIEFYEKLLIDYK